MKLMYEVLDELAAAPDHNSRIAVLQKNDSPHLRMFLRAGFHPNIEFYTNELPPYTPSIQPPGLGETTIPFEIHRAYIFQKNNPRVDPNLKEKRKDIILTQILEALEAREAEAFGKMILKDFKVPTLTYDLVKEAFPNLLP
jgi:hypothetical protein